MKKLIVISGKQYSGKDTLAKLLLSKLNGFRRIGIGDSIKIEYSRINNISFAEIEKNKHLYRNDLITLGNWGRSKNPDYWLSVTANMDKIIVPDIRMKHEAEYFRNRGAFLIRVNSDLKNRSKRGVIVNPDDPTETDLDNYKDWNFIVENDSDIEALSKKADIVISLFTRFIA